MRLKKTTSLNRLPQGIAVVNKARAKWKSEQDMLWLRRCSGTEGLESNRIKGWRLNGHLFFIIFGACRVPQLVAITGAFQFRASRVLVMLARPRCV